MTAAEDAVRASLAARAQDDVLPAVVLLDRVQAGVARDEANRRRRTWTTAVVAAACVALAVLAVGLVRPPRGTSAPAVSESPSEPLQTITDYGLQVQVPASWRLDLTACPVLSGDVVVLGHFPGAKCAPDLDRVPPSRTTVSFGPSIAGDPGTATRTADGRPARAGQEDFTPDRIYWLAVPETGTSVYVRASDPSVAQRILDTVRVVTAGPLCGNVSALTEVSVERTGVGSGITLSAPPKADNRSVAQVQALARVLCALPNSAFYAQTGGHCPGPMLVWTLTFRAGRDAYPASVLSDGCRWVGGPQPPREVMPSVLAGLASTFGWPRSDQDALKGVFAAAEAPR